jgi:hypothetical protein
MPDYYRFDELRRFAQKLRVSRASRDWPRGDQMLELIDEAETAEDDMAFVVRAMTTNDVYADEANSNDTLAVQILAERMAAARHALDPEPDSDGPDPFHPDGAKELAAWRVRYDMLDHFRDEVIATLVGFGAIMRPTPGAEAHEAAYAEALTMLKILLPPTP